MNKRQYKFAQNKDSFFIYPFPVDKKRKFLLLCDSKKQALILQHCLMGGYLEDPLSSSHCYNYEGLHLDGQTPLYRINEDKFHLALLEFRQQDPQKAEIIEKNISKKILQLMEQDSDWPVIQHSIAHRYKKQQQCSECQKLGILQSSLEQWIDHLCQLRV